MRNYDPTDTFHEYEVQDAKRLGAKPWQLELLTMNPSYNSWGPGEDYMESPKAPEEASGSGWDANIAYTDWKAFGPWGLNDLNELVNFHFEIIRDSKECETCGGNGYHPDAQYTVNSFYKHSSPDGTEWHNKITQDELDFLIEKGRVKAGVTLDEINASQGRGFMGHDAINRGYLIEQRLKRLGITHNCPECEGHGSVYTAPAPHVELVLWMIHPRKGAARGLVIKDIQKRQLPAVFKFLTEARQRNDQRFAKIPA